MPGVFLRHFQNEYWKGKAETVEDDRIGGTVSFRDGSGVET